MAYVIDVFAQRILGYSEPSAFSAWLHSGELIVWYLAYTMSIRSYPKLAALRAYTGATKPGYIEALSIMLQLSPHHLR